MTSQISKTIYILNTSVGYILPLEVEMKAKECLTRQHADLKYFLAMAQEPWRASQCATPCRPHVGLWLCNSIQQQCPLKASKKNRPRCQERPRSAVIPEPFQILQTARISVMATGTQTFICTAGHQSLLGCSAE